MDMSEVTGSDIFSQDANHSEFDRDEIEGYMAPGALDGFLGVGDETLDGETQINEAGEQVTTFTIPQVLLETLPIVPLEVDTRVTALTPAKSTIPPPSYKND